jgi:hypothetical protein
MDWVIRDVPSSSGVSSGAPGWACISGDLEVMAWASLKLNVNVR